MAIGDARYDWIDAWGGDAYAGTATTEWAHHGVDCTSRGEVVTCSPADGRVMVFDANGHLSASWSKGLIQPHGLTTAPGRRADTVWICDIGVRIRRHDDGRYVPDWSDKGGRVAQHRLSDGRVIRVLPRPGGPSCDGERYAPTDVAVDDDGVWVADGYGAQLVHRFASNGTLELTLDGVAEGAGRFACPHACIVDRRRLAAELYVADRANGRLVVYDLSGKLRRTVGEGVFTKPSALTISCDLMIVADLRGRLTVLDIDDRVVGHLGDSGPSPSQRVGFPNTLDRRGKPIRPKGLRSGRFNSPHDVAADPDGNLFVAEYVIGGRLTKLARRHFEPVRPRRDQRASLGQQSPGAAALSA